MTVYRDLLPVTLQSGRGKDKDVTGQGGTLSHIGKDSVDHFITIF